MPSVRARLAGTYTLALVGTMLLFSATLWVARTTAGLRELRRYVLDEAGTATQLIAQVARTLDGRPVPLTEANPDALLGPRLVQQARTRLDALPNILIVLDSADRIVYASVEARLLNLRSLELVQRAARELSEELYPIVDIERDSSRIESANYVRARGLPWNDRVFVIRADAGAELAPVKSIIVGASTTWSEMAVRELLRALLAIAPIILALSIGTAYYIAGSALRPLDFVTTEVGAITDGRSLHRRLPVEDSGDELARLAGTLNAMIGRLETSFGALRRFTADASHELKTPLTVLRANVERAMVVQPGSPDHLVALEEALQEITRMADLVDSLLTLARFDEGRFDLHREPIDLEPVVRDVFETAVILGEAAGLQIELPVLEPAVVMGDATRLRQLFLNLITNAIKYTPRGGTVEVSLRRAEETVAFAVRDTGIGIAAADLPYIFDRFWRADRARSRRQMGEGVPPERGGFGLGLAISQWIAQAHGGTLSVVSRLTRGSTFTVTLPIPTPEMVASARED
jgi:two-component system, OmpR family, sensor kinase